MGRIEELELEIESVDERLHDTPCDKQLQEELRDVSQQLDSLAEESFPEFSDTNELP